jgi:primosomal replication protein N''
MTNKLALVRLHNIVLQLQQQATTLDASNQQQHTKLMPWQEKLFSSNLFREQSHQFLPFVEELQQRIMELEKALSLSKHQLAELLIQQIEQQIAALTNAINANEALHHEAQYQRSASKRRVMQKHRASAQSVIAPSQNLYQKLAEHHEFERRLQHMLFEAELARNAATVKNAEPLSQQVLTLHQRLGRCRRAISEIELDIERAEKRN